MPRLRFMRNKKHAFAAVFAVVVGLRLLLMLGLIGWETHDPTKLYIDSRQYLGTPPVMSVWGQLFVKWDSYWYLNMVRSGYELAADRPDHLPHSNLAFAPLYPDWVRVCASFGIEPWVAGVLLSALFLVALLYYVYRFGVVVHSHQMGLWLLVFFSVFPSAWVLNMFYTEAMFCLCLVAFMVHYLERQTAPAAFCAVLLPLIRIAGVALVPAIAADLAWRSWQHHKRSGEPGQPLAACGALNRFRGFVFNPAVGRQWVVLLASVAGVACLLGLYQIAVGDAFAFAGAGKVWWVWEGVGDSFLPLLASFSSQLREDPLTPFFLIFFLIYVGACIWSVGRRPDVTSWFCLFYMIMLFKTPIVTAQMRYLLPLVPLHVILLKPLLNNRRLGVAVIALMFLFQFLLTRLYLHWSAII